ncbi:proline dehydrogenase [Taibaiella sp. KBW10]|uniref:proline dehydrogenase family protein n=1 Tax=Taibaiella sp. KBW10 TaxID=2153357 RepID=UPI000F5B4718|nr:proline dehydrogenase family protein [Taibaiella sp. KBW10]RQO31038.1 proline dehydrogenase [Taibaiella sp. KBW10]
MSLSFDNTEVAFRYKNNKQLKQAHFLFSSMSSSTLTKIGIAFTSVALKINLPVEGIIKRTIFEQFCGGETLQEVAATAHMLAQYNVGVALDYGVEGKHGEAEFDKAVPEFIKAIQYAASQKNIPFIPIKITGFARFGLLEKLHAQTPLTPEETKEYDRVKDRIDAICSVANDHQLMILVDAEESWIQKPVDDLTDAMMEQYNKGKVTVFNTFQLYCHDRLEFLKKSHEKAKAKGFILGAKLVRGAYMEKERNRAMEMGYLSPIQANKEATDKDYNAAVHYCLHHHQDIATFIGTHNEDSCLIAADILKQQGLPNNTDKVYFAQLFGMSDNMTFNLANEGYHASKYLPYGPVKDVIPYLMRRAQENTSVKGQTGRELSLIKREMQRRKS